MNHETDLGQFIPITFRSTVQYVFILSYRSSQNKLCSHYSVVKNPY